MTVNFEPTGGGGGSPPPLTAEVPPDVALAMPGATTGVGTSGPPPITPMAQPTTDTLTLNDPAAGLIVPGTTQAVTGPSQGINNMPTPDDLANGTGNQPVVQPVPTEADREAGTGDQTRGPGREPGSTWRSETTGNMFVVAPDGQTRTVTYADGTTFTEKLRGNTWGPTDQDLINGTGNQTQGPGREARSLWTAPDGTNFSVSEDGQTRTVSPKDGPAFKEKLVGGNWVRQPSDTDLETGIGNHTQGPGRAPGTSWTSPEGVAFNVSGDGQTRTVTPPGGQPYEQRLVNGNWVGEPPAPPPQTIVTQSMNRPGTGQNTMGQQVAAPVAGASAQTLANAAAARAGGNTVPGFNCLAGVQDALDRAGLPTTRVGSAYQLAGVLRGDPRFQEISVPPGGLANLPPGAVVVWQPYGTGPTAIHGHASISLGNGREASDFVGSIVNANRNQGYSVFLPRK